MKEQITDTHPKVEEFMIERIRQMPTWRKFQQVSEMIKTCRALSLSGLNRRYPGASADELHKRLAALWLDREVVRRIYNWDPEVKGY